MQDHTHSYYADSVNQQKDYPTLEDNITCDVCIIGAGFSGLSTGLHLAEKGYHVVLLEAARVGFGATGRNGGQIVNSYSRDVDVIEQRYASKTAQSLCSMLFEGGDIIRERIRTYNIDCDYQPGAVFAALNHKQLRELEKKKKNWTRFGHDNLTLLDKTAIKQMVDSERYCGGLLDTRGGHIHPLNLALGEAGAIIGQGGQIFEQSAITHIKKGNTPIAYTQKGAVKANFLVLAGNAYLGELAPPAASNKAIPCGSQIIATSPLPQSLADELLPNNNCVEDCNYLLDYFRLSADNRLLFGGGVVYGAHEPASVERLLRPKMERVFPQLKGTSIDYAWSGHFLLTYSRMPQFGVTHNTIYYLQGYSGHGVTCTHLAGKLLAEALAGRAERFDTFASLKHYTFPGGQHLRIPLTALGAAYYTLRDKLAV